MHARINKHKYAYVETIYTYIDNIYIYIKYMHTQTYTEIHTHTERHTNIHTDR